MLPIVLWISRHRPLATQIEALRKLYGRGVRIAIDKKAFDTADELVRRIEQSGAIDVVVVAPLSVIHELVKRGIRPLKAVMDGQKFVEFMRIKSYTLDLQPPTPNQSPRRKSHA